MVRQRSQAALETMCIRCPFASPCQSLLGGPGALSHHLERNADLFRAVLDEVERDLMLRFIGDPPCGTTAWERLGTGPRSFLDAATESEVQRNFVVDGPVILGWKALREIQDAIIEVLVRQAMSGGSIEAQPVGERIHMLVAALEDAALFIAYSPDPDEARGSASAVLDRFVLALSLAPPPFPPPRHVAAAAAADTRQRPSTLLANVDSGTTRPSNNPAPASRNRPRLEGSN